MWKVSADDEPFSSSHDASELTEPAVASEKTIELELCYDQPGLIPPPRPEPRLHQRSGSRSSILPAQWMARSRSLASRASQSGSVLVGWMAGERAERPRRPTIGAPSDFRRVQLEPDATPERFTPLELSIHSPRHHLSPLPDFSAPDEDDRAADEEWAARAPPRTLSVLSNPSSEFRIARKPVGATADHRRNPSSVFGVDWVVQPLRPRPSLPLSLDALETVPVRSRQPPALRARSCTEPLRQPISTDADPFPSCEHGQSGDSKQSINGLGGGYQLDMAGGSNIATRQTDDGTLTLHLFLFPIAKHPWVFLQC